MNDRSSLARALHLPLVGAALVFVACSASSNDPGGSGSTSGTSGGSASGGSSGGSASGGSSGGSASGGSASGSSGQPGSPTGPSSGEVTVISLPFFASDEFVPSGFMGGSDADIGAVALSSDELGCKTPRAEGAGGTCYAVTWTANPKAESASWAGVYWQYPSNNWGAKAGKRVASGARRVSFYAAGAKGGESVSFRAGGVNASGNDPSLTYKDTFTASVDAVLTTGWTKYEIDLSAAQYDEVLGGFAWVASAPAGSTVSFYVDDVRWE